MKLRRLLQERFQQKQLVEQQKLAQDYKLLSSYLSKIFPSNRHWDMVITNLDVRGDHKAIHYKNLPYHTRDTAWLVKYAKHIVNLYHSDVQLKPENIRRFVTGADSFNQARNEYEINLTKGKIEHTMVNFMNRITAVDVLSDDNHAVEFDNYFRQSVIKDMGNMGVDPFIAELALERHADLWRESTMIKTFRHQFYPGLMSLGTHFFPLDPNLTDMRNHQDCWLKLREYQYYQDHKSVVDKAKSHTNNMLLPSSQVDQLMRENNEHLEKYNQSNAYYQPKINSPVTAEICHNAQM